MNLKSLKAACIEAVGKDEVYARARSIATELTTASDRYTLSHKLVWQTFHAQLFDPTACLPSSHRVANQAEKISFSEICSTVEKEQNPLLAMLLVTVWLFAQWVSLLIWLAPLAIRLGRVTRLYAIALASSYTILSYRIVHGTAFPLDSTEIPDAYDLIGHVVEHFGNSIEIPLGLPL
ncbi:MAG: hypothetical protein AAF703_23235 [Cyanobacteria bacterium P01_D01_bin.105]